MKARMMASNRQGNPRQLRMAADPQANLPNGPKMRRTLCMQTTRTARKPTGQLPPSTISNKRAKKPSNKVAQHRFGSSPLPLALLCYPSLYHCCSQPTSLGIVPSENSLFLVYPDHVGSLMQFVSAPCRSDSWLKGQSRFCTTLVQIVASLMCLITKRV